MINWLNFSGVREVLTPPFMANIRQEYQFLLLLVDLVLTCFPPHLAQKTQVWWSSRPILGHPKRSSKSVALRLPPMDGWPKKMKHPRIDRH